MQKMRSIPLSFVGSFWQVPLASCLLKSFAQVVGVDHCGSARAAGVRATDLSRRRIYMDARLLGLER